MLPPGHIAGGYLAGKLASVIYPELNQPEYLALSSFFGFFPDVDFFLAFFKLKKLISSESVNHRKFITHVPFLYLLAFIIWYFLWPETRMIAVTFLIGTWSHFLIDTFAAEGIQWLYPFSKKLLGLKLDRKIVIQEQAFLAHWTEFVKEYTKRFSFKAELIIIITAITTWLVSK